MRKIGLYALLIIILLLLVACSPTTTLVTTQTYTVTETVSEVSLLDVPLYYSRYYDSEIIIIDVGEEFAIVLYSTPMSGGGSYWSETHDAKVLDLLADKYLDHATALPSRDGDHYFIFKALQQGTTQITFTYHQSLPEEKVIEEKVFNILIASEEPTSLSQSQELWESKNISDYSYHLQVGTGFRPPYTADVIVTVRDGVAAGYEVVGDPQNPDPDNITPYDTFEKMFDLLIQASQVAGNQVAVTYDPTFGFPAWCKSYSIGNPLGIHFAITISDFTPVPNLTPQLIKISPETGTILVDSRGEPSEVLLKSIQINEGVCEQQYFPYYTKVDVGDPILIVSGTIQNNHKENIWISMWAEGCDETGEVVGWTLDYSHLMGRILLDLETGETGEFVIHMNYAYNINSIGIYANNYPIVPP